MGLRICSFASGSRGNCIYVGSDTTHILVDVGISCKRISENLKQLGVKGDINVLITHTHCDHTSGLAMLLKKYNDLNVFCHYMSYAAVNSISPGIKRLHSIGGDFYIGDITVSPFCVSHDVPCVGYSFLCGGAKISVLTDVGIVNDEQLRYIEGSDVVLIESNHDEDMLRANPRYSESLKRRIHSAKGHLSNKACSETVVNLVRSGTKQIILAHLSEENNTPDLAYEMAMQAIKAAGLSASIEVATQNSMTKITEVC